MLNTRPIPRLNDDDIIYNTFSGVDNFNKTTKCTYFLIVLFSEGSGVHCIDGVEYPINKHQLHFLFPGQHHHWETGPGTMAQQIVVGKKIFEEFSSIEELLFIKNNLHPVFRFTEDIYKSVHHEMTAIDRDLHLLETDKTWKPVLYLRMNILASMMKGEAGRYIEKALLSKLHPSIKEFWSLINKHYAEQKPLSWYAEQLYITPNYLNMLCKKHLNTNALEIINQRMVQEAKQQPRFSEKKIKEITFDLGFKSISAFSAFFRKKSGYSPSKYRKN